MKKMINTTHVEGVLYDSSLDVRTSGPNSKNPGTEYITGSIDIATDDAMTNIVSVHYTYVTAKDTTRYNALMNIVNGVYGTAMAVGKDKATKLRIDSAIALNEFYSNRTGTDELVSVKRNEGGFIHVTPTLNEKEDARATFTADMVITNVRHVDADPDRDAPEKAIVKGAIFNFRNELLPVEFSVLNPAGIDYFEGLGASQKSPIFTKVWGNQISLSVVRKIEEETAFGDTYVREVQNSHKEFVITNAAAEPYEFDSEDTLLASDLKDAMSAREVKLAELKTQAEERAKRNSAPTAPTGSTFTPKVETAADDFDF